MADLNALSIEQLGALLADLHREAKAVKARKREVARVLDEQYAEVEAKKALTTLSPSGRKALARVIGAQGIAPGSAVGTPGAA